MFAQAAAIAALAVGTFGYWSAGAMSSGQAVLAVAVVALLAAGVHVGAAIGAAAVFVFARQIGAADVAPVEPDAVTHGLPVLVGLVVVAMMVKYPRLLVPVAMVLAVVFVRGGMTAGSVPA
jgi:hypothetical protein